MKRVAITGISGYIGTRLLPRLEEREAVERIVGIDIKPPRASSPKLRFYQQDILKPLESIFAENEVDSAVHLVFTLRPPHNRKKAREIDIGGTSNFLEACHKARVKYLLYLSSHTVYGARPDNRGPFKEDSPLRPLPGFQYSWDKAEAERIFGDFATSHKDLPVAILRSCPVIGPKAGDSIIASLFKPLMIAVRGYDPPMQFVHEDDLVEIIIAFLEQKKAGIFNVAGEGEIRYSEIASLCGKRPVALPEGLLRFLMGFSWALHLQKESPSSGLEFIKYPPLVSTEKLKREMGFRFRYSSREAVTAFVSAPKQGRPI